jgi:HK97 gp10 family phage protein
VRSDERRKALEQPGDLLAAAISGRAPLGDRVHHRYKKGQGKVATYYPGNLRASVQRLPLRKTKDAIVGPLLAKGNATGTFGLGQADGYYAHFVEYGTVKMSAQPFVDAGVAAGGPLALRLAVNNLRQLIDRKMRGTI